MFGLECSTVCSSPHLYCVYRRLADGIVHCAGSATYQIFLGYRSRTRSLTLNPNPITDPKPNPKINKNKTTPE